MNTPFIYEIKKRLKPLIEEYSVATRYFFLVVCGFSVSLIFSVIVDYSYPDKIAYLTVISFNFKKTLELRDFINNELTK